MKKSLIIVCLATCFSLIGGNNVSSPILKNINYATTTSQNPDELTKAYQLLELNIDTTKIVSDIRLPYAGLYSISPLFAFAAERKRSAWRLRESATSIVLAFRRLGEGSLFASCFRGF